MRRQGAKELRELVLDVGNTFWPLMEQFISIMDSLRLATHTLQGDGAKLSDVMGAFIRVHAAMVETVNDSKCTLSATTVSALNSIYQRRVKFIYHPAHLVTFALDPRYARQCKASPAVIRKWLKELAGPMDEADALTLMQEYAAFRASITDPDAADICGRPRRLQTPSSGGVRGARTSTRTSPSWH